MKTLDLNDRAADFVAQQSLSGAGVFPTRATRDKLIALYDAKLARWSVPFEERDVATRYGKTHVVSCGDPASPPLVLVHPAGCPAFIWGAMIGALAERFGVSALDTIGDVGKSELADVTRHPRKGQEYGAWMGDVLDALDIATANVMGWSMGGWIAMNFAADRPERVRRLALLAPMGLPSWPVTLRVLIRLASAMLLPSSSKKEKLITWVMGSDPVAHAAVGDWMGAVIDARCSARLGNPYPVPSAKLRAIRSPVLVVLGGQDGPIGDPRAAAARARHCIPDVEIDVMADNTHALGVEAPGPIARRLLDFFGNGR
jgi:pimeloyl-ACP methyl ester carboxylesterase